MVKEVCIFPVHCVFACHDIFRIKIGVFSCFDVVRYLDFSLYSVLLLFM